MTDKPPVVIVERDGPVATITLNRPEARNAMNYEQAAATLEAVDRCQDAGAIVLTGTDPAFCAGLDLRALGVDRLGDLPGFVAAVANSAVPVIGAVNGAAVTGGLELALACDFLIGSERATFADTHARVGVFPGPVLYDLPARVGGAFAREMSLTGNFVDAVTALRVGLLNRLVDHGSLLEHAVELARDIGTQDREMIGNIRSVLADITSVSLEEGRAVWKKRVATFANTGMRGTDIAKRRDDVLTRSRGQRAR